MKFGIENYILTAPFSLIFSIIFFGTAQLGFFYRFKQVKLIFNSLANEIYVANFRSITVNTFNFTISINWLFQSIFRIIGLFLFYFLYHFEKNI